MTAPLDPKLVGAVEKAVVKELGSPKKAEEVAKTLETVVKNDPVLANATGQEYWWQSGVGLFGSGGAGWSLFWLLKKLREYDFEIGLILDRDFDALMIAMGSFAAFAGVLYRRYVPGLKPLFWKWTRQ